MAGRFDSTKMRLAAVIAAGISVAIGSVLLTAAVVMTLRIWLPWYGALGAAAALFLAAGGFLAWRGVRPQVSLDEEAAEIVDLASGMLADLPVEAVRKLIVERPLAALAMAAGFGAVLAKRPDAAAQIAQKLVAQFTK